MYLGLLNINNGQKKSIETQTYCIDVCLTGAAVSRDWRRGGMAAKAAHSTGSTRRAAGWAV